MAYILTPGLENLPDCVYNTGSPIAIPEVLLNTRDVSFPKVVCSTCGVPQRCFRQSLLAVLNLHGPVTMFCVGVGQRTDACHRWHASELVAVHGKGKETYGGCMVHPQVLFALSDVTPRTIMRICKISSRCQTISYGPLKRVVFWNVTPCNAEDTDVFEDPASSIFRVNILNNNY
jgi:hypothetical protein